MKDALYYVIRFIIGIPAQDMANQGLGYARVDPVHGHMVPVVGAPSQRKLGHVSGTDNQAVMLVGKVHQYLHAFPCLCILVGGIMVLRIMADIPEVLQAGLAYVNLPEFRSKPFDQRNSVAIRPVGRAEARHGDSHDILGGKAELFHGPCSHDQGKGGVQTAGNADNRP